MKTLIESLFDTDNVTKELPMSLDLIYGETLNALKKFNLEKIDWNDVYSKGYIPQRPSILDESMHRDDGFFNINIFVPNKYVYRGSKKKDEEVYIGVNINMGVGDEDDGEDVNKFYISRVDVEWIESECKRLYSHAMNLWDRNGWKRYSGLKTNEINEKTIKGVIKYVVWLVDRTIKMMDRDRQEIYDIFHGNETDGGDPLMYGRKDCYWYMEKMKKELG